MPTCPEKQKFYPYEQILQKLLHKCTRRHMQKVHNSNTNGKKNAGNYTNVLWQRNRSINDVIFTESNITKQWRCTKPSYLQKYGCILKYNVEQKCPIRLDKHRIIFMDFNISTIGSYTAFGLHTYVRIITYLVFYSSVETTTIKLLINR